jgi:hypothetical protein
LKPFLRDTGTLILIAVANERAILEAVLELMAVMKKLVLKNMVLGRKCFSDGEDTS